MSPPGTSEPRIIGRYALYDEIAAGGMATVHLGRLLGPVGFSRTVAIKRLHPQFAKDPEFVAMFLDEARLAARIRHPNVVPTLDVVALEHELFLVMEYVQGESLARMVRLSRKHDAAPPLNLVTTIMAGVLHGLHAAHEAKTEQGEALSIVHRDVSPQNVLVGIDGVPRVLDFGVAKAAHRSQTTREGQIKGKIAYMPPEQIRSEGIDRRCDVYAAAAVLWEAVTRKRLFQADSEPALLAMVLFQPAPSPRTVVPDMPEALERIIMRGLERDQDKRYATAREMALELETCLPVASASAIGGWVERLAGEALASRARRISDIESVTSSPAVLGMLAAAEAAAAPVAVAPAVPIAAPLTGASIAAPLTGASIAAPLTGAPIAPVLDDAARASRSGVTDAGEHAATLSQVTQAAAEASRPRSRAGLVGLAAGAALLLGGGLAVFVGHAVTPSSDPGADAKRPAASAEAPAASAATPTAAPSASAAAPDPSAASHEPTARASASARRPPAPPSTGRASAPAPPRASCNPPYTVDSSGIRHLKPECI
jgi:serine/threonine-protein kinase